MRLTALFLFFVCGNAFAYPEMSRYGYANCTACHVSPSGLGLLNEYGRGISNEVLSHWAKQGEEKFAYGLVSLPERLALGAYFRGLQLHQESVSLREGRPIVMQLDFEAGYLGDNSAIVATIGRQTYRDQSGSHERFFSRRHYGLYRLGDVHNFRAGRFQPFYGLNDPNHFLAVRRDLRFGQDSEGYNLEYSYLGEALSIYVTGLFGNFGDRYSVNQEKGATVSASYFLADKHKVGVSFLRGQDDLARRAVGGLWAIVAWLDDLYTLSEFDWQSRKLPAGSQSGYVTTHKINYEVTKGLITYVLLERSHLNRTQSSAYRDTVGAGIQFFPRPHFEILTQWQRDQMHKVAKSGVHRAWLMLNFYL